MSWKLLFSEFTKELDTIKSEDIASELLVLQDLACHQNLSKSEKFFFSAAIKYLQSK